MSQITAFRRPKWTFENRKQLRGFAVLSYQKRKEISAKGVEARKIKQALLQNNRVT